MIRKSKEYAKLNSELFIAKMLTLTPAAHIVEA